MAILQTPNLKLPYPDPDEVPDGAAQIQGLAMALDGGTPGAQGLFFVGEVRFIAIPAPPPGWLVPDGRAISRTAYAKLFAAIGTTYGPGDATTTFNLPDVAGRSLVAPSAGHVAGSKWGAETVALSIAQMPSHAHGVSDPTHAHLFDRPQSRTAQYGPDPDHSTYAGAFFGTQAAATGISIQANGGGQAHENNPPRVAIPAYIYAGA